MEHISSQFGATPATASLLKKKAAKAKAASLIAPITPLTQAEWDHFHDKAKWDSIVALRGPDLVGSQNLKYFTTSVIRWRMSGVLQTGPHGLINDRVPFVIIPSVDRRLGRGEFDFHHFLSHVGEAAGYLHIPTCHAPSDALDIMMAPTNGTSAAIAKLAGIVGSPFAEVLGYMENL